MRVLIVFESSGVVRSAFRAAGHDAFSCDLLPADDGSPYHLQCDAFEGIEGGQWDLLGLHPPCTYLCNSGLHWNSRGDGWQNTGLSVGARGWEPTLEALAMVRRLMAQPERWYLENPMGLIGTRIRPADQTIQPFEFGEDASKRTGLWLHRLAPLVRDPARRVAGRLVEWPAGSGRLVERWSNQTDSGQNKLPPSEGRWKERSRTYAGIASAMAEQWGNPAQAELDLVT